MGIREAIEKLRPREPHYITEMGIPGTIDAVLRILDEHLGECVKEGPLEYVLGQDYSGHRIGKDWIHGLLIGIKNGSHISIYVRRKDG